MARLADYSPAHMWNLANAGQIPGELVNPGRSHRRYRDTRRLRAWCTMMREKKMALRKSRRLVTKPDFFSQSRVLSQRLTSVINYHLRGLPLRGWPTKTIFDMLVRLDLIRDIIKKLEAELETRADKPKTWSPPITRRSEQSSWNASD